MFMNIIELKERADISENTTLSKICIQYRKLLNELRKKELPRTIIEFINQDIEDLNSTSLTSNQFGKLVIQKQTKLLNLLQKELKIVPKNHYLNLWLILGMSAFGAPLGVALGLGMDNFLFLAIGLPIGLAIGIGIGLRKDKKTSDEGRQLEVEMKY